MIDKYFIVKGEHIYGEFYVTKILDKVRGNGYLVNDKVTYGQPQELKDPVGISGGDKYLCLHKFKIDYHSSSGTYKIGEMKSNEIYLVNPKDIECETNLEDYEKDFNQLKESRIFL